MPHPVLKKRLARAFELVGLSDLLLRVQDALGRPHIRAVNYHDVPVDAAERFEAQLRFYADRYVPAGLDDVIALHAGRWPHRRPGILLSFDDGLRSHAEVVAPLLERYGFAGWFFVPPGAIRTPEQRRHAAENGLDLDVRRPMHERLAMTWEEVGRLDAKHVVGCHGLSHKRLSAGLAPGELREEIVIAKQMLEQRLGHSVPSFAWCGGEESSYSAEAAKVIRDAGFRLGFMTNHALIRPGCDLLQLQRSNVEARFDLSLVNLQISGFLDLLYGPKRRRVCRLTRA